MDFDNYDNYEMKEREQEQEQEREQEVEWEREQEQEQEQETNFDEFEDVVVDLKNLEDQQQQAEKNEQVNMNLGGGDDIPNVRKDIAGIKRSITNDVKKIFKDIFNVSIEKKNGSNSESILENTRFQSAKDGRFTIEFKGKRIGWIERDRSVSLFEKKNRKLVDEFKNSMDGAAREYQQTPESLVKNLPDYAVEDILNASVERISERISDEVDNLTATLTEQELREFAGVLNPKGPTAEVRIKALEVQADHWKSVRKETESAAEKGSPNEVERAKLELSKIESLEKTAKLQADFERLKNNEKPIHDETLDIINDEIQENDLSKLERFKQWARENLIGFSAIAISIAGIITTVVIAGRKAVKETAKGVGTVAKALFNLGKKLGPLIAPMLNILATAVSWGVKGLEFLSKNLWLLVIILLWFLTKLSWLSKLTKRKYT